MLLRTCSLALLTAGLPSLLPGQTNPPSFNKEVVRIFQTNCQNCHHPGDVAPFSMMDYASTRPWARSIREKVLLKQMPPWKPTQGGEIFRGARVLSQQDIDTITAWVDAGAPEGDPADLPSALTFDGGWALGEPDLTISMSKSFSLPGTGADIYRCFSLPTNLPADTYISAVQVAPGNHSVVHHVVMFSDPSGASRRLESTPGEGYPCFGDAVVQTDPSFLAAWAPGVRPAFMNVGTAMRLPRNGYVVMQVHYHLSGSETEDQTQVGLYFSRWPVDKLVSSLILLNSNFRIPAGNSHYEVTASGTIGGRLHLVNVLPHMHLLGRESHVSMVSADGATSTPLIDINDWDFNWQGFYDYVRPVAVTPGSRLRFSKFFDNSVNNPRNPNLPPVAVEWGEQTTDEMAVAFFGYTQDLQHLIAPTFSADNIVNRASLAAGAAQGELVSLYGVGLGSNWESSAGANSLAGVTIRVAGVPNPLPLFYASPTEARFQMPFEASGRTTLFFQREDGAVTAVDLTVADAQPGLFTADGSGAGLANARLEDVSTLSADNPGARGSLITLYATGLGAVTPSVATGATVDWDASCVNAVKVTLGDRLLDAESAGLVRGAIGLYAVTVRIPADLEATGNVAVKLTVAGVDSNAVQIVVK